MIRPLKPELLTITLLLALVTGCKRGPGLKSPRMARKWRHSKRLLSREELAPSPGLVAALANTDQSADQQLSADEIEQRVASYAEMGMGVQAVTCLVTMRGRPLVGAEVSFVPEMFLTDIIKSGKGQIRVDGSALLVTEDCIPGLSPGLYRVVISKLENGQETIPDRCNTDTELGHEVSADAAYARFDLS